MTIYRLYRLDEAYRAISADQVPCTDDSSAMAAASNLAGDHTAVEVWRGSQIIAQIAREQGAGGAPTARPKTGRKAQSRL